jgi:3-oxoadipate enol-lactonase
LQDYSFIAVDHRGHGRGIRSSEVFELEDAADDAAALVKELGIGPVVAVGYSMGGPISLLMARRHRSLVCGLVLEATAMEWRETRMDRVGWHFLRLTGWIFRSSVYPRLTRRLVHRAVAANPALAPYEQWLHAEIHRGDPTAIVQAGRALGRYDARLFAPELKVPAAVVVTTKDHLVRPGKQQALAGALGAEIIELRGDHSVFWDRGPQFASATRTAVNAVVRQLATS